MLVVSRTTPVVWSRWPARVRERVSAPACIWRAASAMASAAGVGETPRPVRSNNGAPSCASNSVMWRLSVGCSAPVRRAAPIRLPASSTARKLFTRAQSKRSMLSVMQKCMTGLRGSAMAEWGEVADTASHLTTWAFR